MEQILLLGSKSQARRQLLDEAKISYELVNCAADESKCEWATSLRETVDRIALYKMEHVVLPQGKKEGEVCYVLTADTLGQSADGTLQGKPTDRYDAIEKIKSARGGASVGTSFCLDKRQYKNGKWELLERIQEFVTASYDFHVPDEWIDIYLEKSLGLQGSGAIAIEGYGTQFLCSVQGSYSAIVGLPMFELRCALGKLGFFEGILG